MEIEVNSTPDIMSVPVEIWRRGVSRFESTPVTVVEEMEMEEAALASRN